MAQRPCGYNLIGRCVGREPEETDLVRLTSAIDGIKSMASWPDAFHEAEFKIAHRQMVVARKDRLQNRSLDHLQRLPHAQRHVRDPIVRRDRADEYVRTWGKIDHGLAFFPGFDPVRSAHSLGPGRQGQHGPLKRGGEVFRTLVLFQTEQLNVMRFAAAIGEPDGGLAGG